MSKQVDPIKFCEETYPATMAEFKEQQKIDYATFCKKQMDYGPGNIAMGTPLLSEDDITFSLGALNVRVNDKVQRLLNLINKSKRSPQNESIDDAYMDLSVYGIIARIVLRQNWGK